MQPPQAHPIYLFGDFELDTLRRVLVSRANGKPVDITGRVIEALVYLVQRPGQLVSKKELIEALWPHVVVEEGNLTQTIHTLRRVLGEQAGDHRYIATEIGRGYRFVAEVTVREGVGKPTVEQAPARRPKRMLVWVVTSAVVLILLGVFAWRGSDMAIEKPAATAQPSIAVLPFVDMSAEQDQMYFAEGLSEEILNLLTRADSLRVIARTSSFSFKDQNADIGEIAKRLAVTHVLEGSVRKSGERVRITAQLIDGATSAHLWSDTYDRDVGDIFGVQSEIAGAVADALHVTLRAAEPRRAETRSTQAYEHYLQGRHLFNRRSVGDLLQAKAHFEDAVKLDPDYGRAWAGLAGVYRVARVEAPGLQADLQKWREAAEHAVALAPDLAEAHLRAAQYYWHTNDTKKALVHSKRATALDPTDPLVIGLAQQRAILEGRMDEAVAMQRRMVASDPLSATLRGNLGVMLIMAGHLTEAQAELERALELSPASVNTKVGIADALIAQGRPDEALEVIASMPAGIDRDERVALVHFARGDEREGNEMLVHLVELAGKPGADPAAAMAVAELYAFRNDPDRAFRWIDTTQALSEARHGTRASWLVLEKLQLTPFFKPLHGDARWHALMAEARRKYDEFK